MTDYFDQIVCINLDKREDRWKQFQTRLKQTTWPFGPVERISGIDALKTGVPSWWKGPVGAWGCFRSHVRILEDALNKGIQSILVLEDDVIFPNRCEERVPAFINAVPDDWDQIYFGGRYVGEKQAISHDVVRAFGVILTHAYAIRGPFIQKMYHYLCSQEEKLSDDNPWHVDMQMSQFHQNRDHKIYCPKSWLMRQTFRTSDIRT